MRTSLQIALTATAALALAACSSTGPSGGGSKLLTLDGNPPLVIAHRGASGRATLTGLE